MKNNITLILSLLMLLALGACGQAPAFNDLTNDGGSASFDPDDPNSLDTEKGNSDCDDIYSDDCVDGNGNGDGDGDGNNNGNGNGNGDGDGDGNNNGNGDETPRDPGDYDIPGIDDDDDLAALHKCMEKWGELPFGQTIPARTLTAISIGGFGTAINDTEETEYPELVLVKAAVNVGGTVNYKFLNPNAYYCIKVNVNVLTDLTIDLHCNARLADSKVSVNVGSVMSDNTAAVGVHVGSVVTVNTVRPEGDQCIR